MTLKLKYLIENNTIQQTNSHRLPTHYMLSNVKNRTKFAGSLF